MTAATNSPTVTSGAGVPHNLVGLFDRFTELHDALANRLVGKPVLQIDEAANDSDKTFTVPANTVWTPFTIWVELISDATVGNRQMALQFRDGSDDVIAEVRAGAVQAASITRHYLFSTTGVDLTGFRDTDWLSTPMPFIPLPETFDIRVYDKAAVAAAADDMVVQMMVQELVEI